MLAGEMGKLMRWGRTGCAGGDVYLALGAAVVGGGGK